MKTTLLFLFTILSFNYANAQIVNIPNASFKARLLAANATTMQIASSQTPNTNGIVASFNSIDTNSDGEIQVSEAQSIKYLYVQNVNLSDSTGLEAFINLEVLYLTEDQMTSFNPNLFPNLKFLDVSNNQIPSLTFANPGSYVKLHCRNNLLTSLDLNGFVNLKELFCNQNQITSLNTATLSSITLFSCEVNLLTSLDASPMTQLQYLNCDFNQLTSLNVTGLSLLQTLNCRVNQLTSLNLSGLTVQFGYLYCSQNQLTSLNLTGLTGLGYLDCSQNQLTSLNLSGLTAFRSIECNNNQISSLSVSGLFYLQTLYCSNNQISSLTLTSLPAFRNLGCGGNPITTLNLTSVSQLRTLSCENTLITSLNINNLTQLITLYCGGNQLSSLNLTNQTLLQYLHINNLPFAVNLNAISQLRTLNISGTPIATLNLNLFPQLQFFYCENTLLSSIDGRTNSTLNLIKANNCQNLTSIYSKNGYYNTNQFANCPNMQYLCTDENEVTINQNLINTYGYTNCHVNTYCSFVPGGTYYTIQGTSRYDANSNGCDATDSLISRMKFSFTTGTTTGYMFANNTGTYSNDVQSGTHTFLPLLEIPTYFSVSPSTASVTFPTTTSPFTQNFCISPNGNHSDLEITIFPIGSARPGFSATYEIVYKNKGTQPQNGSVNLAFDDSVLNFISAIPTQTNQNTNNVSWNFSNLLPFETRTIRATLQLNSPTQTPPLNSGNILTYSATVNGAADETANDNFSTINQTVTNAFDPNDKTCVEGTIVSPSMVGEYMHYVIRFQNDGTANAQNVVIKDVIDTTKFEVSTLVPLSGSAPFITRIIGANKVEFIFQNINLPFASGSNTGFVTFKIKTKSTLIAGDTFSNSANIHFDYNFPITTNNYTTTVQTLGINENLTNAGISIYPNPVKDIINFNTQENVKKVEVYDIAGRILSSNSVNDNKVNLSDLQTGNYILKVYTENGVSNTKIIKE